MAEASAYEQLLLELINRARLDPLGEAQRLGIDLNSGLAPGTIDGSAKQVLAGNSLLNDAAGAHTDWMLATGIFSHTGAGGSDPGQRMSAAGYQFTGTWRTGENINWSGTSGAIDLNVSTRDAHDSLFRSAGHRENLLNDDFREIGAGVSTGVRQGLNATMTTEKFAKSGDSVFVTGVAYNDFDNDGFYDIGEGQGGIAVTVSQNNAVIGGDVTETAGGHATAIAGGTVTVTFSGGGLPNSVTAFVNTAQQNAKVDLVNGNDIYSSASTTLGDGAQDLKLLGTDNLGGGGNSAANTLIGNKGNNYLTAGAGNDRLSGGAGHDKLIGGAHKDTLWGGSGNDTFDFNFVSDSRSSASSRDVIMDYSVADDTIDLFHIDANRLADGNQAFKWLGSGAYTGEAGQLRIVHSDNANNALDRTYVRADTDGDQVSDFQIELVGLHNLTQSDFVL
ncbi:MAG: M10 family metallopeptidase C-terminal domain-containing protein [Hyphomicrobium sp.]